MLANLNSPPTRAGSISCLQEHRGNPHRPCLCRQKAAQFGHFPHYWLPEERAELVQEMIALVQEEISHFKMVHDLILERGLTLGENAKTNMLSR